MPQGSVGVPHFQIQLVYMAISDTPQVPFLDECLVRKHPVKSHVNPMLHFFKPLNKYHVISHVSPMLELLKPNKFHGIGKLPMYADQILHPIGRCNPAAAARVYRWPYRTCVVAALRRGSLPVRCKTDTNMDK